MEAILRNKFEDAIKRAMIEWSRNELVWGIDDCMLAIANIYFDVIGIDPAKDYRGKYQTKLGAYRVLGKGGTLMSAKSCAKSMGWVKIDPLRANVGDAGLIPFLVIKKTGEERLNHAAAICRGSGWFVSRSKRGFVAVPSSKVTNAWSIQL